MSRQTVKISLFRGGAVVSEAVLTGSSLTMGKDWRTDLVDPASDREKMTLVSRGVRGIRLHLPSGAKATFRKGESTLTLEDMAAWGLVRKVKSGYTFLLRPDISAEFTYQEASFRLHFINDVQAAVISTAQVTGHVPMRFRFGMPDFADLAFAIILIVTFLLYSSAVRNLSRYPIPEVTIQQLPRRISRIILEPVKTPLPSRVVKVPTIEGETPKAGPAESQPKKDDVAASPEKPEEPSLSQAPVPGAGRDAIRRQVSRIGVLGVLTGRGTAGRSSPERGMTALQLDRDLSRSLDEVLSEVDGITVPGPGAGDGSGTGTESGEGEGLISIDGIIGDQGVNAPMEVARIGGVEGTSRQTEGRPEIIDLKPVQNEQRSTRAISRIISAHTGAIRYAYNRELRKNPSLRGKIVLAFTISAEGEVTDCRVETSEMNWPPLEDSLVRMAKGWKFPAIPEGTVTVTYPLVFFPSM